MNSTPAPTSPEIADVSAAPMAAGRHADESAVEAYRWLLILGFPPDVAAARAMPELFAEPDHGNGDDSTTPFPGPVNLRRAA